MVEQKTIKSLRDKVLTKPNAHELADLLTLMPAGEELTSLRHVMPFDLLLAAEEIIRRRTLRDGDQARRRVDDHYGRHPRLRRWITRQFFPAILRAIPWQAIVPLAVVWMITETIHRPKLVVAYAHWEVLSSPLDTAKKEPDSVRKAMGAFWMSRFATDVLRDTSAACSIEIANSKPSTACINEITSRLDRIIVSEDEEIATIALLNTEIDQWCPGRDGPASARLLYEPDFVSNVLWPQLLVGDPANPIAKGCDEPTLEYRRRLAHVRLDQYRELVQKIYYKAGYVSETLKKHLPPTKDQFDYPAVALVMLRNDGGSDAVVDLTSFSLLEEGEKCQVATLVTIDPYSHAPTEALPSLRITVSAGSSAKLEMRVDCRKIKKPNNRWHLDYAGDSLDFSFSFAPLN